MKRLIIKPVALVVLLCINLIFLNCDSERQNDGLLIIPLKTGLAKNNGATPWYAQLSIGSGGQDQLFKLIMDNVLNFKSKKF